MIIARNVTLDLNACRSRKGAGILEVFRVFSTEARLKMMPSFDAEIGSYFVLVS